jgi:hypothetical protein
MADTPTNRAVEALKLAEAFEAAGRADVGAAALTIRVMAADVIVLSAMHLDMDNLVRAFEETERDRVLAQERLAAIEAVTGEEVRDAEQSLLKLISACAKILPTTAINEGEKICTVIDSLSAKVAEQAEDIERLRDDADTWREACVESQQRWAEDKDRLRSSESERDTLRRLLTDLADKRMVVCNLGEHVPVMQAFNAVIRAQTEGSTQIAAHTEPAAGIFDRRESDVPAELMEGRHA